MLYNGMEAGDTTESGAPALFERLPVFWQTAERRPDFPRFYSRMIALRKAHAPFRQGETVWLRNSDDARVLTFARRAEREELVVAINFSSRPFAGTVETPAGQYEEITPDIRAPLASDASPQERAARQRTAGLPALTLDAWGWRIFKRQK
jgi:glycosidase